jgi:hypothetical protein
VKFLILVIDVKDNLATPEEGAQIDLFNDQLQAKGHWIHGWGLYGPEFSTLIDNRAGVNKFENRSLVESAENYSGLWIIEAASEEEATILATEASKACNRKVELRRIY